MIPGGAEQRLRALEGRAARLEGAHMATSIFLHDLLLSFRKVLDHADGAIATFERAAGIGNEETNSAAFAAWDRSEFAAGTQAFLRELAHEDDDISLDHSLDGYNEAAEAIATLVPELENCAEKVVDCALRAYLAETPPREILRLALSESAIKGMRAAFDEHLREYTKRTGPRQEQAHASCS